jgi:tRNA1Val (adenine37-N6)-methyltransferase
MANSYFQFKQFIVRQEKCAMKVCTDACLFGAYISYHEENCTTNENHILDIGTGTGLLALMLAQKVRGNIDAVDIDEKAFEQAKENFENSTWVSRLRAYHSDIIEFAAGKKYDIIISNPPFFRDSLKSGDIQKNLAKHTTALSYADLAATVSKSLGNNGKFYILLPFSHIEIFEKIAAGYQLFLIKKINIKQSEHSKSFRTIALFSNKLSNEGTPELLSIKNEKDEYTESFIELLKDYYLYL